MKNTFLFLFENLQGNFRTTCSFEQFLIKKGKIMRMQYILKYEKVTTMHKNMLKHNLKEHLRFRRRIDHYY